MGRLAARGAPLILLIVLYWSGLTIWFYQDDFGWLNVRHEVESWRDVPAALFTPKAHGNIRPWSETGFFLKFSTLFGLNPLPFRIAVFATLLADMLLLGAIARRLTSSEEGGFWAQVLWVVNPAVAVAASWTSIYNQSQYLLFVLAAFYCWMRYAEGSERRFLTAAWIAFLLGFGSLEVNIVFPALALGHALLFARAKISKTLPMFAVSAAYAAAHFLAAPADAAGPYALYFDASLPRTLWGYWRWALEGPVPVVLILTAGAVWAAARSKAALLGLLWFLVLLAPVLPLRDHMTDYYLTGPAIGLALLGAAALERWRAATVFVLVYVALTIPAARAAAAWHHARGALAEDLVLGARQARDMYPASTILLTGVSNDQFFAAVVDASFHTFEIPRVYLAPGSERGIAAPAWLVSKFILPPGLALRDLEQNRAIVFDASGPVLKNVTAQVRALAQANWKRETPRQVIVGDDIYAEFLGPGWGPIRNAYRRIAGPASVRIGGPRSAGERLFIGLRDPRQQVSVKVEGIELPPDLALPVSLTGQEVVNVVITPKTGSAMLSYLEIRPPT